MFYFVFTAIFVGNFKIKKMKSEVIPKLKELELQLNYVCYNEELIPMLGKVWNSFYDLENEIYKLHDDDILRCKHNDECTYIKSDGHCSIRCKYYGH